MTCDMRAEFGRCWDADTCTMDPGCMLYDMSCLPTEQEMADARNASQDH